MCPFYYACAYERGYFYPKSNIIHIFYLYQHAIRLLRENAIEIFSQVIQLSSYRANLDPHQAALFLSFVQPFLV